MAPLHAACINGDTERVRQLLDEGAPVDQKNKHGRTALMYASEGGRTEAARSGAGFSQRRHGPIHIAALQLCRP